MLNREQDKRAGFEGRYKYVIPDENERRIVAKANEQCFYYLVGVERCAHKMLLKSQRSNSDETLNYDECRPAAEAYFRCTTKDQYGTRLEEIEPAVRPYFANFANCIFRDGKSLDDCRRFHDDILRHYARQPDNKLSDAYS